MANQEIVDILIVGSGIGGATAAAGLAPTGARILILERGARLRDSADARDARAIFQRGVFRPDETWLDGAGQPFNPGNYYYVAGNSKLYGAVLFRYRARDFEPVPIATARRRAGHFHTRSLSLGIARREALQCPRRPRIRPTEPTFSGLPDPCRTSRDQQSPGALERVGLHLSSAARIDIDNGRRAQKPLGRSLTRGLARWMQRPAASAKLSLMTMSSCRKTLVSIGCF
jgi:hypothetical protein